MTTGAKMTAGARQALAKRDGGAIELGAPPSWPACELQRVRAEARGLARARARRQQRSVLGLAAAAAAVVVVLGVNVVEAVAAAVLGVVAWWMHETWGEKPVLARWRAWVHGRHLLERELHLLGPEWRLLWDRRVHGLPAPAIIAVGPSGAWALWWPEPGIEGYADPHTAATTINELVGLPSGAYVLQGPPGELRTFVHEMACAPRAASPGDVARAADQLHSMLLQEPVGVGL